MREHSCRGERVLQRVVRPFVGNAVALADVGEAVRERALRVELARQPQRADVRREGEVDAGPPRAAAQEGDVEASVVRRERGAVQTATQFADDVAFARRGPELSPAEPVDVARTEPEHPPEPRAHEAAPRVEHGAVAIGGDDGYL